jgi:hypothetical protein
VKGFLVSTLLVVVAAAPAVAAAPQEAIPWELLAGSLGSFTGVVVGGSVGRVLLGALGIAPAVESQLRFPVMIGIVVGGITAGASVGVIAVGSWLGVDGNVSACFVGAFLGALAGMLTEPLLYASGLFESMGPVAEALGILSAAVSPAIGATIGFNMGARAHPSQGQRQEAF